MPLTDPVPSVKPAGKIPLWLKLLYSSFVAVLVPWYWSAYGPTNFLYFCHVALLLTLVALWREDRLLSSMSAVGILLPEVLWMADLVSTAEGYPLVGMTGYMFDPSLSLFTRGLSFFHFWLPLHLWFGMMMVGLPLCIFMPTHLILSRMFLSSGLERAQTVSG